MKPSSSQSQHSNKYFSTKSTVDPNFNLEDEQSIPDETTELLDNEVLDNEVCISLHPSNMYPAFLLLKMGSD